MNLVMNACAKDELVRDELAKDEESDKLSTSKKLKTKLETSIRFRFPR